MKIGQSIPGVRGKETNLGYLEIDSFLIASQFKEFAVIRRIK